MSSPSLPGGVTFPLREDLDRDADDYGPSSGGKKRKVPGFAIDSRPPVPTPARSRVHLTNLKSNIAKQSLIRAHLAGQSLFLTRKAALITLYLDAQSAILKAKGNKPKIPDVPNFEKLLPALEGLGIGDWEADSPGWRNMQVLESSYDGDGVGRRWTGKEKWRCAFDQKRREAAKREKVVRGGWVPEGSFELDIPSEASKLLRARIKDQTALKKLANDLRSIVISTKAPVPEVVEKKIKPEVPLDRIVSQDSTKPSQDSGSDISKKKKPKKKKRSVLANQSNPHHVNNYRPTRTVSDAPETDIYSLMSALLFPQPTRFLAARPTRKTVPLPGTAPAPPPPPPQVKEDEYVCCFCEYSLFYGSERARRRAIKDRRKQIVKKDKLQAKVKDVIEGRRKLDDSEEEDDCDDEEDEARYGKCTCGRRSNHSHGPQIPPEPDPP